MPRSLCTTPTRRSTRRDFLKGLESATPWMRGQLAIRCGLRVVPELLFIYDDSPERAARIDALLRQIAAERASQPPAGRRPTGSVM